MGELGSCARSLLPRMPAGGQKLLAETAQNPARDLSNREESFLLPSRKRAPQRLSRAEHPLSPEGPSSLKGPWLSPSPLSSVSTQPF